MTALKSGNTLVTGANGFVASWTVLKLLQEGYSVKGTVRSADKGEYLIKKLQTILGHDQAQRFSYVVVEDIVNVGVFDEITKDVDGVCHISSPFHFNATAPSELIDPAVRGTLNVLEAANKSETVKRVVITSSVAAVVNPEPHTPREFTEEDWNTHSAKECEELGDKARPQSKYRASKTLAEKTAWEYMEKSSPSFALSTITPPLILGPLIRQADTKETLNTSSLWAYAFFNGSKLKDDPTTFSNPMTNLADVRDVAAMHVDCLQVEKAAGERFVCVCDGGFNTWQDMLDAVHDGVEDGSAKERVPVGVYGAGKRVVQSWYTNRKAKSILGSQFIPYDKTCVDTYKSLLEYEKEWNK